MPKKNKSIGGPKPRPVSAQNMMGIGVGKGPGRRTLNIPLIKEVTDPQVLSRMSEGIQKDSKVYKMGPAMIVVSPPAGNLGWRMSISQPDDYPHWDWIVTAWYTLVPQAGQRFAAMILPPMDEYIDVQANAFQIHEIRSGMIAGYVIGPYKPGTKVHNTETGTDGVIMGDGVEYVEVGVPDEKGLTLWWRKSVTTGR